jgi:hypothetical protein
MKCSEVYIESEVAKYNPEMVPTVNVLSSPSQ